MRRAARARRRVAGFALLGVMLAGGLACLVAATVVVVAVSVSRIVAADERLDAATAAAEAGMLAACDFLTWGGSRSLMPGEHHELALEYGTAESAVTLTGLVPLASGPTWLRRVRVEAVGYCGRGRAVLAHSLVVRPQELPCGLSIGGDAACAATVIVEGCGVYCGGDLHGREHITFQAAEPSSASPAPDYAHGERWPAAGVHAAGCIYAAGVEVHSAGAEAPATDGDSCTGESVPEAWVSPPRGASLAALRAHAIPAGDALTANVLDLSKLSPELPSPLVVAVAPEDQPLRIVGWRSPPPAVPALTVVVVGDATVDAHPAAEEDEGVCLAGQLVVTGTLVVRTPTLVEGSLTAGALSVRATLVVRLDEHWRNVPPPGPLTVVRGKNT